jgi:hypothetical protein
VEVKEDLFILKVGGSRELNAYDKKTMNVKYLIEEGGRQVESESGTRNLLDFPLFVGKKWSDSTSGINPYDTQKRSGKTIYTHDFKVEAIEDVTTAAGTIKAYKIYYVGSNKNTRSSGWIRYWYSPEAKTWVKRQVEKSTYWALSTWAKDAELISSHLK